MISHEEGGDHGGQAGLFPSKGSRYPALENSKEEIKKENRKGKREQDPHNLNIHHYLILTKTMIKV